MTQREERKGQDPNVSFKRTAPVTSLPSALSCLLKAPPHPPAPQPGNQAFNAWALGGHWCQTRVVRTGPQYERQQTGKDQAAVPHLTNDTQHPVAASVPGSQSIPTRVRAELKSPETALCDLKIQGRSLGARPP